MILTNAPVAVVRRWAVASNERALANARVAAVECSRRLLDRAEVDAFLLAAYPVQDGRTAPAEAVGR